jgi:hypothetical protein
VGTSKERKKKSERTQDKDRTKYMSEYSVEKINTIESEKSDKAARSDIRRRRACNQAMYHPPQSDIATLYVDMIKNSTIFYRAFKVRSTDKKGLA